MPEIKKEYVYIFAILSALAIFFYATLNNSKLVEEKLKKEAELKNEINQAIENNCAFGDDEKWTNIIRDLDICKLSSFNCSHGQYAMNNECACGCIDLDL